jgi:hypothetical protein
VEAKGDQSSLKFLSQEFNFRTIVLFMQGLIDAMHEFIGANDFIRS